MANTPQSIDVEDGRKNRSTLAGEIDGTVADQSVSGTMSPPVEDRPTMWPYFGTAVLQLLGALISFLLLYLLFYGLATSNPSDIWKNNIFTILLVLGFPALWLVGLVVTIWLTSVRKRKAALLTSLAVILVGLLLFVLAGMSSP